jgi:hypothetical protein
MNVKEINSGSLETLAHYVETTLSLTVFTIYLVVTLQSYSSVHRKGAKLRERAAWPGMFLWKVIYGQMYVRSQVKTADDMA